MLRKIKEGDKSYLSIIKENNYLLNKEVFAEINNEKKLVKDLLDTIHIKSDDTREVKGISLDVKTINSEVTFLEEKETLPTFYSLSISRWLTAVL